MRAQAQTGFALLFAISLIAYAHTCVAAPVLTFLATNSSKQTDTWAIIREFSELVDRAVGDQPVYDYELREHKSILLETLVNDEDKNKVVDIVTKLLKSSHKYKDIQHPHKSIVFTISYSHDFLAKLSTRKALDKLLDEYEFWNNSSRNYSIPQLISRLDNKHNLDLDRYLALRKLRENSYRFIYKDRIFDTYEKHTLYGYLFNDINEENIYKSLDTIRGVPDQYSDIYTVFNEYLVRSHTNKQITDETYSHARFQLAQVYKPVRTSYENKIVEAENLMKSADLSKLPGNKLTQVLAEIRYTEPNDNMVKSYRDNEKQNDRIKYIRHRIIDHFIEKNNQQSIIALQEVLKSIAEGELYHAYSGHANKEVAYKYNKNRYFDEISKIAKYLSGNIANIDQIKYIMTMYKLGFDSSLKGSLALIYYENKQSKTPPDPVFNANKSGALYNAMLDNIGELYSAKYLGHLLTYDSKEEVSMTLRALKNSYVNKALSEKKYKEGLKIIGKSYDPALAFLNDLEPYHSVIIK